MPTLAKSISHSLRFHLNNVTKAFMMFYVVMLRVSQTKSQGSRWGRVLIQWTFKRAQCYPIVIFIALLLCCFRRTKIQDSVDVRIADVIVR